jgi:hypothetical protein
MRTLNQFFDEYDPDLAASVLRHHLVPLMTTGDTSLPFDMRDFFAFCSDPARFIAGFTEYQPSRPLLRIRSTSYGNRSSPSYSPSRRTTEGVEGGLGGDLFARLYCHCRRDRRCRQRDLRCEERFLSRKTSRLVFRSASERLLRGKEGLLYGWDQKRTIGCSSAGRDISN